MKTKLLRKVRKRFDIRYYPNVQQMILFDRHAEHWLSDKRLVLFLGTDEYQSNVFGLQKLSELKEVESKIKIWDYDNALKFLKDFLKDTILREYAKYGTRRNKKNAYNVTLWWRAPATIKTV